MPKTTTCAVSNVNLSRTRIQNWQCTDNKLEEFFFTSWGSHGAQKSPGTYFVDKKTALKNSESFEAFLSVYIVYLPEDFIAETTQRANCIFWRKKKKACYSQTREHKEESLIASSQKNWDFCKEMDKGKCL
ncbi:hypothetical protein CEXT_205981 [Caerostris extrusa]|uniref:Uncharacterized protein n=1 Tax=Caerostris extrusa TaxID=172846 RepID=A0AAV4TST7_CAEEX|nr:hypothetical protein CEXT_205981 [Caerostris extrusa]